MVDLGHEPVLRLADLGQNAAGPGQQRLPALRERDLAAQPVEQLQPELGLELLYLLR